MLLSVGLDQEVFSRGGTIIFVAPKSPQAKVFKVILFLSGTMEEGFFRECFFISGNLMSSYGKKTPENQGF